MNGVSLFPEDSRSLSDVGIFGYEIVEIVIQTKAEIQRMQAFQSAHTTQDKMDVVGASNCNVQPPVSSTNQTEPKNLCSLIDKIELLCSDSHKRYSPPTNEASIKHTKSTLTGE